MTLVDFVRTMLVANGTARKRTGLEPVSLEQSAKLAAGASAVCFAAGVACTAFFYASVSLRPFEPLNVQQVFLGLLFFAYAGIAFVLPTKMGLSSLAGWSIQVLSALFLVIDGSVIDQIAHYVGAEVAYLDEAQFTSVVLQRINALLLFLSALAVFRLLAAWLAANPKAGTVPVTSALLVALLLSLWAFGASAYPRIPFALGGGAFPIVQIQFVENAPLFLTSEFDISRSDPQFVGSRYYGRLVYETPESLFLSSVFWFSHDVVEVRREYIGMLRFGDFNPTERILPSTIQK